LNQPLVPDGFIVAFDKEILLRLSRLEMLDGNAARLSPLVQSITDVFRAIVDTDGKLVIRAQQIGPI
jgi:hypothetical protein